VLIMSVEFSDRLGGAISEFYALILFALAGMMFASSANDFSLLFVSIELITVTFYILTSYQRSRAASLEAGVKYLTMGALSTGVMVFGIALVSGVSGKMNFTELAAVAGACAAKPLFLFGAVLVFAGLAFKIAAFPFQIWTPDVYQGAPTPVTAFLAVGSKAAGIVLLLRVLFVALPPVAENWRNLLVIISGITILYGNLCAIPQRNVKRLMGYSSIAQAGYLLLGVAALNAQGQSAVLYYLGGYLCAVLAVFTVISLVSRETGGEDVSILSGLHQRSPLLAAALTLAMVSLAGIPPLAGFFGKFLLFRSLIASAPGHPGTYCLVFTALIGVVISLYYYGGIIRAVYWSRETPDQTPIQPSLPIQASLYGCVLGMLVLGLFPAPMLAVVKQAALLLKP